MTIYFYTPSDPYGCFSNFSRHGILMDDGYWPTVEHYFQAQKFTDETHREKIRRASTPKEAKRLGWSRSVPLRSDWETVKEDVMHKALLKKFETHGEIREILLATDGEEIVENAPGDFYWGCGADGSGKNRLGVLLMEVRNVLRHQSGPH